MYIYHNVFVKYYRSRDREFIDPWAPNAGPMNTGGFNGLNSNNMMANTMGNLGNAVNPLANNLAQQLPVMGNNLNSLGNLSSMVSNGMAGNLGVNLPNNNTPTFITGNGSLNSMGNNNGLRSGNGSNNDEGKNTTQVTIPKDVSIIISILIVLYVFRLLLLFHIN